MALHPGQVSGLRSWTLNRRLGVAVLAVGVLLVGVVAGSAALLLKARAQQDLVVRDYDQALGISQDYFVGLLDIQTSTRGYALTSDEEALAPMRAASVPGRGTVVREVAEYLPPNDPELATLRRVDAAAGVWYFQSVLPAITDIRAGRQLSDEFLVQGRARFDLTRTEYRAYLGELRAQRTKAADQLTRLTELLFGAVVTTALIAVLGVVALWSLLVGWVTRPVARLAGEVRAVSDGDLRHAVLVDGAPELRSLAEDVDRMRRRLVEQISQVEAAGRQLGQAHARLEEQTADLARSNRDLEQFAYVASHDLQEPLRKVASFVQLLQRRYGDQLDERADQYIEFAVDGAKRMQQLINDLLEFSRVGRGTAKPSSVPMEEVLAEALTQLETTVRAQGAKITADPLPIVHGQRALLVQLLQNLLGNAIKFHSDQPPVVHLGVRRVEDGWQFGCTDNGIGIDTAYAERVFMIFQRLHPKDVYSGTGIGLALCKRIVEHHGGRIWVEPADPERPGTTISWTLPALPPQAG